MSTFQWTLKPVVRGRKIWVLGCLASGKRWHAGENPASDRQRGKNDEYVETANIQSGRPDPGRLFDYRSAGWLLASSFLVTVTHLGQPKEAVETEICVSGFYRRN
ncbi:MULTISPECIES: hypothetical protein [Arthrobacter]|uniref:hypothetical protein n=1 Tax=Arthrobacter TaxID=1663 RepID=UPI00197ACDB6|nr:MULTISPECIES: hypothetical protein [Arthrobacter]